MRPILLVILLIVFGSGFWSFGLSAAPLGDGPDEVYDRSAIVEMYDSLKGLVKAYRSKKSKDTKGVLLDKIEAYAANDSSLEWAILPRLILIENDDNLVLRMLRKLSKTANSNVTLEDDFREFLLRSKSPKGEKQSRRIELRSALLWFLVKSDESSDPGDFIPDTSLETSELDSKALPILIASHQAHRMNAKQKKKLFAVIEKLEFLLWPWVFILFEELERQYGWELYFELEGFPKAQDFSLRSLSADGLNFRGLSQRHSVKVMTVDVDGKYSTDSLAMLEVFALNSGRKFKDMGSTISKTLSSLSPSILRKNILSRDFKNARLTLRLQNILTRSQTFLSDAARERQENIQNLMDLEIEILKDEPISVAIPEVNPPKVDLTAALDPSNNENKSLRSSLDSIDPNSKVPLTALELGAIIKLLVHEDRLVRESADAVVRKINLEAAFEPMARVLRQRGAGSEHAILFLIRRFPNSTGAIILAFDYLKNHQAKHFNPIHYFVQNWRFPEIPGDDPYWVELLGAIKSSSESLLMPDVDAMYLRFIVRLFAAGVLLRSMDVATIEVMLERCHGIDKQTIAAILRAFGINLRAKVIKQQIDVANGNVPVFFIRQFAIATSAVTKPKTKLNSIEILIGYWVEFDIDARESLKSQLFGMLEATDVEEKLKSQVRTFIIKNLKMIGVTADDERLKAPAALCGKAFR